MDSQFDTKAVINCKAYDEYDSYHFVPVSLRLKNSARAVGSAMASAAMEPDPLITQLVNPKEYPTAGW